MNNLVVCEDRLKNMLVSDKRENPIRIERVLKSELINVMKNYFEISSEDLTLDILVRDDGKYDIQINVVSRAIKFANTFEN